MVDCFKCKKELERIDKFSSENLESISIPSSVSEDDRLCGECVRHLLEPPQDI
jgi:hypothetical protein